MNFSNVSVDLTGEYSCRPYHVKEVLQDVCYQIDYKILIGMFLILTFYTLTRFVLPIARKELAVILDKKQSDSFCDMFYSVSETFSLGAILLLIGFYITQNGWNNLIIVWSSIITFFMLISAYIRLKGK